MFTENEVAAIISKEEVRQKVVELRKDFLKSEAKYFEINEHDFLSLMIMTPTIGIALANGSVSLFEEMALNKKARKLSLGGYFLKKDPVVVGMGFLIKAYDTWNKRIYQDLSDILWTLIDKESLIVETSQIDESSANHEYGLNGLNMPFLFIRCLTSFFMSDEDEDIVKERTVSKVELEVIKDIGSKLGFDQIPFFQKFVTTFKSK